MNSTADEVWEFMKLKYPIEKISGGKKYICYLSTPGFEEPDIYGYNVIEAVSMLSPFPASKQFPKVIEPGRRSSSQERRKILMHVGSFFPFFGYLYK
jgi:hypothetical protein